MSTPSAPSPRCPPRRRRCCSPPSGRSCCSRAGPMPASPTRWPRHRPTSGSCSRTRRCTGCCFTRLRRLRRDPRVAVLALRTFAALVMTSGNVADEPIVKDAEAAAPRAGPLRRRLSRPRPRHLHARRRLRGAAFRRAHALHPPRARLRPRGDPAARVGAAGARVRRRGQEHVHADHPRRRGRQPAHRRPREPRDARVLPGDAGKPEVGLPRRPRRDRARSAPRLLLDALGARADGGRALGGAAPLGAHRLGARRDGPRRPGHRRRARRLRLRPRRHDLGRGVPDRGRPLLRARGLVPPRPAARAARVRSATPGAWR